MLIFAFATWQYSKIFIISMNKYIENYKIYLLNFGSDYLKSFKRSKMFFIWDMVILICLSAETLLFIVSFFYAIYLRLNS